MTKNQTMHGLRGIAAVMVLFFHFYGMLETKKLIPNLDDYYLFRFYDNLSAVGVTLFFVISGILITQSLYKHDNIKKFIYGRIKRVYPVFLVFHIFMFAIGPVIGYEWFKNITPSEYAGNFLSNLFLLPGTFDLPIAQKNAWTLSYEFVFYISSTILYYVLFRIQKGIIRSSLLVMVSLGGLIYIYYHDVALYFIIGVILYFIKDRARIFVTKHPKYFNGTILLILFFWIHGINKWFEIIVVFLMFFSIIYEIGMISRVLKLKFIQFLGTISYSLYLIHPIVLFPLREILLRLHLNVWENVIAFVSVGIIISILAAYLSQKILEEKLTRLLDKWAIGSVSTPSQKYETI